MGNKNRGISILTRQFLLTLLISAVLFVGLMVVVEVYWEYENRVESLREKLEGIPDTYLDIIIHSLWIFDDEQLINSVESLNNLEGIYAVKVVTSEGEVFSAGSADVSGLKMYNLNLNYQFKGDEISLGELSVYYGRPGMREIIISKLNTIVLRAGILVLAVLGIVFIIVNKFIAGPIILLSRRIGENRDYSEISLDRKRIYKRFDEIDDLVESFNRNYEQIRSEISRRMEDEAKLKASVEEKSILLSEIHHRVKNNLQIIISLLTLQRGSPDDYDKSLEDSIHRIKAISGVHELLYKSDDFSRISLYKYVESLTERLSSLAGETEFEIFGTEHEVNVSLEKAIPLGLIINELVSNSIKHAFPAKKGKIQIEVMSSTPDSVAVRVSDDGIGIVSEDNLDREYSLGYSLVRGLVSQLNGRLDINSEKGLSVTVSIQL